MNQEFISFSLAFARARFRRDTRKTLENGRRRFGQRAGAHMSRETHAYPPCHGGKAGQPERPYTPAKAQSPQLP
jgi:hypothetical protein